jgi:hypothetical protein
MPTTNPNPKSTAAERHERARHIFARMLDGLALREIAAAEGLSLRRVQQIIAEEIARRDANPTSDYMLLQIARLECALEMLGLQIDAGKASAVPAFVKVIGQLGALTKTSFHPLPMSLCLERAQMQGLFERLDVAREIVADRRGPAEGGMKPGDPQGLENTQNGEIADSGAQ